MYKTTAVTHMRYTPLEKETMLQC